jgi:3-oxosteroid 1-dehydrogenase
VKFISAGETIDWKEQYDLICIGSGLGGLSAAVAAADLRLRAVVIEKADKVGGTTSWSSGIVWVGNSHLGHAQGAADSASETRAYLDYLGGGRNNAAITQRFIEQSPRALQYFEQKIGLPFYVLEDLADHYYPLGQGSHLRGRSHQLRPFDARTLGSWQEKLDRTPFAHGRMTYEEMKVSGGWGGYRNLDSKVATEREARDIRTLGGAVAGHFFKAALDRDVHFRLNNAAEQLIVQDNRVIGVQVYCAGETVALGAKNGVVLATGKYDSNPRLMGWFDEFNPWPPHGSPRNHGDGLVMALEIGAAFTVMHWNLSVKLGRHVNGESVDGQPILRVAGTHELGHPHGILVNRAGRRFADESSFGDVASKLRHFDAGSHELTNVPCYFICDAQYMRKYGLPPVPPGGDPPQWLPRANTAAELAQLLGIDPVGLSETVTRFNSLVAAGQDTDFQRGRMTWSQQAAGDLNQKNPNLGSISEPPFLGIHMHPFGGNSIGLVTTENSQVISLRGETIPGLYACGDVVALEHVGVGFQAGLPLAGAMTFGWLAAQHAAQTPVNPL